MSSKKEEALELQKHNLSFFLGGVNFIEEQVLGCKYFDQES